MVVDGYRLTNTGLFQTQEQNSTTEHVRLAVSHDGRSMGTLDAGTAAVHRHRSTQQVANEVDIHTSLLTLTDLYTILQGIDQNGSGGVEVKVLVNPMIGMIWLAGGVFLLGAVITLWPDPREARMLARRYATALAREA